jgi:hypothetical protein
MDVHLTHPDLQAKLDRWVTETGRGPDELVEDAMAGYFDELAQTREILNSRYDDLKSGRVKPISVTSVSLNACPGLLSLHYRFLFPTASIGHMLHYPHNVQYDVWNYLQDHPDVVATPGNPRREPDPFARMFE